MSRFAELQQLEAEVEDLTDRLETRKLVDRAKGVLQQQLSLSEPDAFRWIQKTAMDLRLSMRQVAEGVITLARRDTGTKDVVGLDGTVKRSLPLLAPGDRIDLSLQVVLTQMRNAGHLDRRRRHVVTRPVDRLVTRRVLTMDFVDGRRVTDLTPLAQLFSEYLLYAVRADSPIKSVKDLVATAKKNGGKMNYASAGNGTSARRTRSVGT